MHVKHVAVQRTLSATRMVAGFSAVVLLLNVMLFALTSSTVYAEEHTQVVDEATTTTQNQDEHLGISDHLDEEHPATEHEDQSDHDAMVHESLDDVDGATNSDMAQELQATADTMQEVDSESQEDESEDQLIEIAENTSEMEIPHTVLDAINQHPQTAFLSEVLEFLAAHECVPILATMASAESVGGVTIFAPSNQAIADFIGQSDQTDVMEQLRVYHGQPDELCQIVSTHLHVGATFTADLVPTEPTLITNQGLDDGVVVQRVGESVTADNATVILANVMAANGVVHIVDQVILSGGPATIEPVVTDSTSPALSGTISVENPDEYVRNAHTADTEDTVPLKKLCVTVQVEGSSYDADVDGLDWSIQEGVIEVDPLKPSTLFAVIVRKANEIANHHTVEGSEGESTLAETSYRCVTTQTTQDSASSSQLPSNGNDTQDMTPSADESTATENSEEADSNVPEMELGELLGITLSRSVLQFASKDDDQTDSNDDDQDGNVLGEQDDTATDNDPGNNNGDVNVHGVAVIGKGGPTDVAAVDPDTVDSDGDGVVDSLDTEPNNPDVTGLEDTDGDGVIDREDPEPNNPDVTGQETDETDDEDVSSDTSNLLWWFVGGGAAVTLWYLLWQRGGVEE